MEFAPIQLKPLFKTRIWGSDLFQTIFNLKDDCGPIGECWNLVDCESEHSVICGGRFDGKTLRWFLREYGESFGFTSQQCKDYFGLLNKYLDANSVLSLQVHPDSAICEKYSLSGPKVKCWYVIDARDDAFMYVGMVDGTFKNDMKQAISEGKIQDLLQKRQVKPGDFFYIPAGTLHALGAGIMVAEIGTPSNAAFRLFDWNRSAPDGNVRKLAMEQSMESVYFDDSVINEEIQPSFLLQSPLQAVAESLGQARVLVENPYFSVAEIRSGCDCLKFKTAIPFMIVPISGKASIYNKQRPDEIVSIEFGKGVVFPATQHGVIEYEDDTVMLICSLGPVKMASNNK